MFLKKLLNGLGLAAVAIFCIFLSSETTALLLLLLAYQGTREFYDLAHRKGTRPSRPMGILATVLLVFFAYSSKFFSPKLDAALLLTGLLSSLIALTLIVFLFRKDYHVSCLLDASVTVLGFLYVGWLLSFVLLIRNLEGGDWLLFLVVASTSFCDTGAYFLGGWLGKHKLYPSISPHKTAEGALGGLIFSVLASFIIGEFVPMPWMHRVVLGILIGVMALFGDLCESLLKRDVGVKDAGNILEGHGGVLDRLDSLFFTAFVGYYYLKIAYF